MKISIHKKTNYMCKDNFRSFSVLPITYFNGQANNRLGRINVFVEVTDKEARPKHKLDTYNMSVVHAL